MRLVEVYKSTRKADTFLYVEHGSDLSTLPEGLMSVFGAPQHVLSMKLTPERRLARYSGEEVLAGIEEKGYFLQLPDLDADEDRAC